MSKVVKYYYSSPVMVGTIGVNPIIDRPAIFREKPLKRYTIAAVYDDESSTIKFGLATCQPIDNFCKAVGREIALKNATVNPFHIIEEFSGKRNDYADEVIGIMIEKEKSLLKKECPWLFNPKYIIDYTE